MKNTLLQARRQTILLGVIILLVGVLYFCKPITFMETMIFIPFIIIGSIPFSIYLLFKKERIDGLGILGIGLNLIKRKNE